MCRMICEANCDRAKQMKCFSETPNRNFHEFALYFGEWEDLKVCREDW
jgi:hypothetical protein